MSDTVGMKRPTRSRIPLIRSLPSRHVHDQRCCPCGFRPGPTAQELRAGAHRGALVSPVGIARLLRQPAGPGHRRRRHGIRPAGQRHRLLHPAAAAQRHRHAAHGPCVPADADGHAHPLPPDAGQGHQLGGGQRPRRHRHADRRRAPASRRGQVALRPAARAVHRARLGLEERIGRRHQQADAPAGRLGQLGVRRQPGHAFRLLHHGPETVHGRGRGLRAPV